MDFKTAIDGLESDHYFVWDDFLSQEEVTSVMVDYQSIYDRGEFKRASVGKGQLKKIRNEVRTDETYWLDPLALTPIQSLFWNRLDDVKSKINETLFLGLMTAEGHYSHYPIDGHYQKHIDRFNTDDARTISFLIYFNSKWAAGDGGELRVYDQASKNILTDINPSGGRLFGFMSADVPHEVLTTLKSRASFAGWWKRRSTTGNLKR